MNWVYALAQRQTYVAIREKNMNILTLLGTKSPFRVANILGVPSLKRWILDARLSRIEVQRDHVRRLKNMLCYRELRCCRGMKVVGGCN